MLLYIDFLMLILVHKDMKDHGRHLHIFWCRDLIYIYSGVGTSILTSFFLSELR